MRLQEKANQQFENMLDVRSIVKTRIDLSILLNLLLTKEQRLLFNYQNQRAFVAYDSEDEQFQIDQIRDHDPDLT